MKYPPDNVITVAILAIPRARLRANTRKKLQALEGNMRTFKTEIEQYRRLKAPKYENICNAALFCSLLNYDLTILLASQLNELSPARRSFYSRQLSLSLFEATEDLPTVLGKDFRTAIWALADAGTHIATLAAIRKQLSAFMISSGPLLKKIRIFCAAHREHDGYKQLEIIEAIDDNIIYQLARNMDDILTGINSLMLGIATEMGKLPNMIRNLNQTALT